ncbi:MAG: FkbM family methyltransferase [Bacteroidetes bacterium]|nr:FkbM family methyltransferase [Bacteroidota bacterium]
MISFIYNSFVNSCNKTEYWDKVKNVLFGGIRKIILFFADPLVTYKLWNYYVKIPFSHNLPVVIVSNKNYNTNLPRISTYIDSKYPSPSLIDIGANIGDTAALLRSFVDFPIMCIEGDNNYYNLLKINTSNINGIKHIKSFLGEHNEEINAVIQTERGTGTISNTKNSSIQTKKLDTIICENSEFKNAKLLKIDTDGFDFKIMKGATELLQNTKPVIFTEFDQNLMKQINEDYNDMFAFFKKYNYEYIIFYDNFGDYLLSININETEKIEDITSYFDNRNTDKFCDICVFHKDDKDIFELTRKKEIEFFSKNR